jgi:hypothetical protein
VCQDLFKIYVVVRVCVSAAAVARQSIELWPFFLWRAAHTHQTHEDALSSCALTNSKNTNFCCHAHTHALTHTRTTTYILKRSWHTRFCLVLTYTYIKRVTFLTDFSIFLQDFPHTFCCSRFFFYVAFFSFLFRFSPYSAPRFFNFPA